MQDYTPIELFEEERYGLEQHTASGRYCLSIAVCTPWVEYLEHYELTPEEFEKVSANVTARLELVAKCRVRKNDDRLMEPPPADRGTPCTGDRGGCLFYVDSNLPFRTLQNFRAEWFSLRQEIATGTYCLSIPVDITPHFQSSEEYELTPEEYRHLSQDKTALLALKKKCCDRQNDARFMGPIPSKRGTSYQ